MKNQFITAGLIVLLFCAATSLAAPHGPAGDVDLALGHKVHFAPAPNYSLTKKGGTDATDLTNEKLSQRKDQEIWRDTSTVGWSYPGRYNLAVDLGEMCRIDEIAMRFCGGSASPGSEVPGWIEVFVSKDGKHYQKVGMYWRWRKGEAKKFGLPQSKGKAWVYALPFKNLHTVGRYVGIRFDGTAYSDELYVWGKRLNGTKISNINTGKQSGFTVTQPQFYFNKPYLKLATNIVLPVPVGMATPDSKTLHQNYHVTLDLPAGIKLAAGQLHKVWLKDTKHTQLTDGGNRYQWTLKTQTTNKAYGRLFLQATGWKNGQKGTIHYQYGNSNWQSPKLSIPVQAVTVPKAPRLKGLMLGMGWWNPPISVHWPGILKAYRVLGLNTYNVFSMWMPEDRSAPEWELLDKARKQGFFVSDIDSPYYNFIKHKHGKLPKEVYFHFKDGTIGKRVDPAYRGKYFQEEVKLFAKGIASVKPNFVALDIEKWGWRGPMEDAKKTPLDIANYKKSRLSNWQAWQELMGRQIWGSLVTAAREANKAAGGKPFEIGGYDFHAYYSYKKNDAYQNVFSFHQLYPKLLDMSQISTYMSFQPYAIAHLGDLVRKEREIIKHNDIMPWVTPGDAGSFAGSAFKWGLLECYLNGARGVWFWSSRTWDSEDLIAYNKVIRAIAPVEPIIVHGQLANNLVRVIGPGRVSAKRGATGSKLQNKIIVLAADYFHQSDGKVKLSIHVPEKSILKDLMTGKTIKTNVSQGVKTITIPLNGKSARLVCLMPKE